MKSFNHTISPTLSSNTLLEATIQNLRFPLIVCVVYIHSTVYGVSDDFVLYNSIYYLFSGLITQIAVPLFFFISGYLFFYKLDGRFSSAIYLRKINNRIKTLLIPYVFWNVAVTLLFLFMQSFFPQLITGNNRTHKLVSDYNMLDWIYSFWDTNLINGTTSGQSFPACFQLWFIRDLLVIVLLSPLFYYLIKKIGFIFVISLGIGWILDLWPPITGFNGFAIFFFSLGAYISIHQKDFIQLLNPYLKPALLTYTIGGLFSLYYVDVRSYFYKPLIVIGLIWVIIAVALYLSRKQAKTIPNQLTNASFFIYAFHAIPVLYLNKMLCKIVEPMSDVKALLIYLFGPLIIITSSILIYLFLHKVSPSFTSLITGGRSSKR